MYNRIIQTVFTVAFIGLFLATTFFIMIRGGTLTIELPDQIALSQCDNNLQQCLDSKIPECTPVRCDCGSSGVLYTIIGAIFGLIGYGLYFYALHKVKKLENKKEPTSKTQKVKKKW